MEEIDQKTFTEKGLVFQIGVAPRRIDILTEIDGVEFSEAYRQERRSSLEISMSHFYRRTMSSKIRKRQDGNKMNSTSNTFVGLTLREKTRARSSGCKPRPENRFHAAHQISIDILRERGLKFFVREGQK